MRLLREVFVQICTKAILNTREKVTICNQVSGYEKFHREIKENDYFTTHVRGSVRASLDPDDHMSKHALIEQTGLGNCQELAEHLLIEVGREIEFYDATAKVSIISSSAHDHVYLEIKIKLRGEQLDSVWEVDAWDLRIIDVSPRPNGSIKNHEVLDYGYSGNRLNTVYTDEIDYRQKSTFFQHIPKPVPGKPLRGATPPREIVTKHAGMYDDFTVAGAAASGKFDPTGEIHHLQQVSSWQKR